jgi:hypothetical protein
VPTDKPSRADEQLVSRLQDAGVEDMSWTRLKRWRKAGLVPDPEQYRILGERGSSSAYPEEAFEQALLVAQLLERHRDFDKVAFLLFLAGHTVEVEALRRAVLNFLDVVEREIMRDADGASDPDEIAARTARAVVGERLRTSEQRAYKQGMLEAAGGERQLARFYATMIRPLIGAPLSAGGLFAAYKSIGQDFRSLLGADPAQFASIEQQIDSNDHELEAEGGILKLIRDNIGHVELQHFVNSREFCRDAAIWVLSLGISLETPHRYYSDCVTTLATRELPST